MYFYKKVQMKKVILLWLSLGLISCGSSYVNYDYDEQQDFSKYKTYAFYPEMNSGLNELDEKRLIRSTEAVLQSIGFTPSNTPDIYINFKTRLFEQASNNNIGVGIGGGNRGIGVGVGGSIPIGGPQTFLGITTDFVDVGSNNLVWQAISEGRFNMNAKPENRENFFLKIMQKTFSKYPPKKK